MGSRNYRILTNFCFKKGGLLRLVKHQKINGILIILVCQNGSNEVLNIYNILFIQFWKLCSFSK